MLHVPAQYDILERERMVRPVFVMSLCASVLAHAILLGVLPPFTEVLPWQAAPALEVILQPPLPPPAPARVEVSREPAAPKSIPRKARVAPRLAPPPAVREPEAAPTTTAASDDASMTRVESESRPLLTQNEPKPPTVALAPSGQTETSGVARAGEQKESGGAAVGPAVPAAPPSFSASYLRNPRPPYPLAAQLNGEQGTVVLNVRVTREGTAASVTVEKTSGSARLDAAAMKTVREWRFVPARRGGQAVDESLLVPIRFELKDAS